MHIGQKKNNSQELFLWAFVVVSCEQKRPNVCWPLVTRTKGLYPGLSWSYWVFERVIRLLLK
jgi:hypothetical protein